MNDDKIKRMIDDNYDDAREDGIRSMLREFYSRKMAATSAFIWVVALVYLAVAVYSAIAFFRTDQTRYQIMYAAIFICCVSIMGFLKVFAWQMLYRNSIKREIKRLELRIAELTQALGPRQGA
jgi:hypothetical protein